MLADPGSLGNALGGAREALFEPQFWAARGALAAADTGRGAAWYIETAARRWVLRHYRRGGFARRLTQDRYVWTGESRVRAFAEYRLLACLNERGLPVPRPVAARYERRGLLYRCDLIMERLPDALSLSLKLAGAALPEASWRAIGAVIGRLHAACVDHADLNAHNILVDARGAVSIIDFDRGRARAVKGGGWQGRNLRRLHRSLEKIAAPLPPDRFGAGAWQSLLEGYHTTVSR